MSTSGFNSTTAVAGRYFDGRSSAAHPVALSIGADGIVRLSGLPQPIDVPLTSVTVSDRIGNIPRRIVFADGAVFETTDNDGVDAALKVLGQHKFAHRIASWERRWSVALWALSAIAIVSWLFVQFGVPALATLTARILPISVDRAIGAQGLRILDQSVFKPSELSYDPPSAAESAISGNNSVAGRWPPLSR